MTVHQYGIRCAHLQLKQKLQALPGLVKQLPQASAALEKAHSAVETRQLDDHPKQPLLQKLLAATAALIPGTRYLLLSHPAAFFTLYQVITNAGLVPQQLDRSGSPVNKPQRNKPVYLHGLANRADISLQCFLTSPEDTQGIVEAAIQDAHEQADTAADAGIPLPSDEPSQQEKFLEAFPSLNPYSAAVVAHAVPLPTLMTMDEKLLQQMQQALPCIPARCLQLLLHQLTWGHMQPEQAGGALPEPHQHFADEAHPHILDPATDRAADQAGTHLGNGAFVSRDVAAQLDEQGYTHQAAAMHHAPIAGSLDWIRPLGQQAAQPWDLQAGHDAFEDTDAVFMALEDGDQDPLPRHQPAHDPAAILVSDT
ncbi:hypothetical protein WJX73_000513 [Symbiochloris irregularis]|uniref:Uncharacterized protein n=1 Tax=Symbiochloris irregularis TaxID=706552 RepID=A0AAW1PC16_9CHLO